MKTQAIQWVKPASAGLAAQLRASEQPRLTALPPLSLYIHWPWCVKKCPYCDFNSHEPKSEAQLTITAQMQYVQALLLDLEDTLPLIWGRLVHTIFIGGGTPSLMLPEALDALLAGVRARLKLQPDAEITLEANPGTYEAGRYQAFADCGVNRLSIGVQSFDDAALQKLGRIHSAVDAHRAIAAAQAAKLNVNFDLMYALPEQSLAAALLDIETALRYAPQHLSAYHLTLEPNTAFAKYPPALPDDELSADMQEAVEAALAHAGFEHYETSAFALPNARAQHNLNYWQFGDYIGIGAGAHGKISSAGGIVRTVKHKHPQQYVQAAQQQDSARFLQLSEPVSAAQLPFEFMLNALRLTNGFPLNLFTERCGLPVTQVLATLEQLSNKGLLNLTHSASGLHVKPSELGRRFVNDMLDAFLVD